MMQPTQIVGAADQIHLSFQTIQGASGMTTFARQVGYPLLK